MMQQELHAFSGSAAANIVMDYYSAAKVHLGR